MNLLGSLSETRAVLKSYADYFAAGGTNYELWEHRHKAAQEAAAAAMPPTATDPVPRSVDLMQGVSSTADWAQKREQIMHNLSVVMGPLPEKDPRPPQNAIFSKELIEPPETGGLPVQRREICLEVEKNDFVKGYLLFPQIDDPDAVAPSPSFFSTPIPTIKLPAILCPHQTTADPADGKREPAGVGGDPSLHYALELAHRGYVTLTIDYPGFGENDADPYKRGYESYTAKGIFNHIRAIDFLASRVEVDPERIGALGHSLGGHNSIFLALFDPRIKVIGSSCGYTSFRKYAETVSAGLQVWAWKDKYMPRIETIFNNDIDQMPFEWHDLIAALAPRPFFTNAPKRDANFDLSGVRDVLSAAKQVYALHGVAHVDETLPLVSPDVEHAFPKEVREQCYAFFDTHLKFDTLI